MIGRVVKILAISTLVASFGVWAYAFSGQADRDPPDLLQDRSWSEAAETICADAVADVATMPNAADAPDPEQRSEQVLATTDRYQAMVDQLAELEATGEFDRDLTAAWIDDWRLLLDDRRRYAAAVVDDPAALFTISAVGPGIRLDRRITRLATVNGMPSCSTPTDV